MAYIKLSERAAQEGLMTPHQMRDYCALTLGQWRAYLSRAIIPRPTVKTRWARWPLYEAEEAEAIRLAVVAYQEKAVADRFDYWRRERENRKVYSQTQAASALKVPHITFQSWVRDGKIPRPMHRVGCYLVYDEHDLERIREWCRLHYRPAGPYNG